MNLLLQTDSYKLTHWPQYPSDIQGVFSYFESRVGARWDATLVFGTDYHIRRYLSGTRVDATAIAAAEEVVIAHLGGAQYFNRAGWEHIKDEHDGKLPLRIRAVPEGTIVPVSNVLMTVESTCPQCYWLTNYVESLLTHMWYPCTVATLSRSVRDDMANFLRDTSDTLDPLPFMLHDFGYRGATSDEAAGIGGAAHLINFKGTDTLVGMEFARDWYDADLATLGFSVPATEHSVMTAHGRSGEYGIVDNLIKTYPTGIVSVVADSYDIYKFVDHVCTRANEILARDGVFVVRPDSTTSEHKTPEELSVALLERLWQTFDGHINDKGYRVLDSHVRMLWGDGIDPEGIHRILQALKDAGFAAHNMVFGMGGGLLQKVNRDTQRFAFKASAMLRGRTEMDVTGSPTQEVDWFPVSKNPLDASKASKAGRLTLIKDRNGSFVTALEHPDLAASTVHTEVLETVFENGYMKRDSKFSDIRKRAEDSDISTDFSRSPIPQITPSINTLRVES